MIKKIEYFLHKVFKNSTHVCCEKILKNLKNEDKKKTLLSTLNTNSLYTLKNDIRFNKALHASNLIVPDGIGTIVACRLLGLKIKNKISGSDIFYRLNDMLNKHKNFKCFFFGSTKKTIRLVIKKMKVDYPNIKVTGFLSPPFKDNFNKTETKKMINYINRHKADILWIALTQPKQEIWAYENLNRLNTKFIGSIGAVFDFYSGKIKRAPIFIQNLGLEWLFRIAQDPKRLWKRYLYSNFFFIFRLLPYIIFYRLRILLFKH